MDTPKPQAPANGVRQPHSAAADLGGSGPGEPGFRSWHGRAVSTPVGYSSRSARSSPTRADERAPLIRSYSTADLGEAAESLEYTGSGPVAGGTIMGIHNLAIVFPQFIVSCSVLIMVSVCAVEVGQGAESRMRSVEGRVDIVHRVQR
jgi:solute carrier family 45 protein 1/2/4